MKMLLIKMMTITAISTVFLSTPMSMGMMLLIQTTLVTLLMNKMTSSSWFIMITFLMMIGGLLILFSYMSSVASNEKFKMNFKLLTLLVILIMISDEMILNNTPKETEEFTLDNMEKLSTSKMYSKTMMIMILMVLYLLLTMISVSKIVKIQEGPLRSKNYE